MPNEALIKIFYEMAIYLEMQDVAFKPQAFNKAAESIEALTQDVKDIYKSEGIDGLKKIPGVGQGIADKIIEYLETGRVKDYEALRKKMPVNIEELTSVEGVGPKMVRDLYENLKIKNLKDLEESAKAGKIRGLPQTEKNILQSIEFLKRSHGRFLLGEILPEIQEIISNLKNLKEVKQISEAGSVRRRKETIGDADILITTSNPKKVVDYFVSMPGVVKIWGKGPTKASVRLNKGFDVDLRVLPENKYGSALQYFTGSKEHNISLRKIAIEKGLKLSEYGLFRGVKMIAGKTEEEIYKKLGMEWMPAEIRENRGEIEASIQGKLPKLIKLKDIKADLHIQTNWNGGHDSIADMAGKAQELGYEYIGI
ncbi:MAG: helix-hairpin-helix domain-containing protein, partial [Candidatus Wolfebacteria bacterium]|nr:helix-hairpin-helix domain-containing protein [Candidatus Wolfebacteria bacterium]